VSGCASPCIRTTNITYESTTTDHDGRYHFPQLPAGSAVVLAGLSGTHRQVCGAFAALTATTQLDVEVTPRENPQPSPVPAPLIVTGQIYEVTPAGRVGLEGAAIHLEWGYERYFLTVVADANGFYQACGLPAGRPLRFEVFRSVSEGYDRECNNYLVGWDFGAAPNRDFEFKPGTCQ
jgi:hypothetical protein